MRAAAAVPFIFVAMAGVLGAIGIVIAASYAYGHCLLGCGTEGNATAAINAGLNVQGFVVMHGYLNLTGNGEHISVPVDIIGRCYVSGGLPVPVANSSAAPPITNTTFEPCNVSKSVVFAGLKPYSFYTVGLYGSESPYCPPRTFCPMFVLRVNQSMQVETGAAGSMANVSFAV